MDGLKATERRRQSLQEQLDSQKDAVKRNRWGQFATPIELSIEIAKRAKQLWGEREDQVRFFDPAMGTGSFFSALQTVFPSGMIEAAAGIELDEGFAAAAEQLWTQSDLQVTRADFTALAPPQKRFNLVLTNPPYVRHHHLDRGAKERLKKAVDSRVGLDLSGLAGLYCHFLLLCDAWLDDDALCFWLIPSEFMDVNYGAALKEYLLTKVSLIQIHRFSPSDAQFADALVSSAVVVFKKTPPAPHCVTMSFSGSLLEPDHSRQIDLEELASCRKWTRLPRMAPAKENGASATMLGDLFTIKRGLATGDNKFFVLKRDDAVKKGVPKQFAKPILPSPRYLSVNEIDDGGDGFPRVKEPLALIDCDLPEEEVERKYPKFWEYLSQGKDDGVHKRYLTSRRTPWYSQERRDPPPFVCTYMGRARKGAKPFRFIWNKSNAVAANVYLLLYPKGRLKTVLDQNDELFPIVLDFLRSIDAEDLIGEGRVYGGRVAQNGTQRTRPSISGATPGAD